MLTNFQTEWMAPFIYWAVISASYIGAKRIIENQLKGYNNLIRWYQYGFYLISCILIVGLITFTMHNILFLKTIQYDDDSVKIVETVKLNKVLLLTMIPSLVGVLIAVTSHNKALIKDYSKDFFKE